MTDSERRIRERIPLDYELEIQSGESWIKVIHCKDLSMGGMRIVTPFEITKGTEIQVRFGMLNDTNEATSLQVAGIVVHSEFLANQYWSGVRFESLPSDASIFLYRLIQYHKD